MKQKIGTIQKVKNVLKKSKHAEKGYFIWRYVKTIPFKGYFQPRFFCLSLRIAPYTMVGYNRLHNVYVLAKEADKKKIPGAFVECGVWKGGCSGVMAYVSKKNKTNRQIWLFDSFEGLPQPTKQDGVMAKKWSSNKTAGKLESINECVSTLDDVNKLFFSVLKINKKNTHIEKGWFQNTLPKTKKRIGKIAILRLDGDWYESTKVCLDNLYDLVVPGGYIIIDDYGHWVGCKRAIDEFFKKRKISVNLQSIDYTGKYFIKP
jgi:O-methyltransferase